MSGSASPIQMLTNAKQVLDKQCDAATSDDVLKRLTLALQAISDEIDATEQDSLAKASYIPRTDAFKSVTDAGKTFVNTLNQLKSDFAKVTSVLGVLDDLLKLVSKVAL